MQRKIPTICFIIGGIIFICILALMNIAYWEDLVDQEAFTNHTTWAKYHKARRTARKKMGKIKDMLYSGLENSVNKVKGIIY